MDILSYVKGVGTFKKSELVAKIAFMTVVANDLSGNIANLKANKIDLSKEIEQWSITKSINRELQNTGYRGVTFEAAINAALDTIKALDVGITKIVKNDREEVWDGKILNLRQANLLNLIEHVSHFLKYTTMVYDVLITMQNKNTQDPERILARADVRMINQTAEFYKGTLIYLLKGARVIVENLEAIPEVEVSESSIAVMEATEDAKKSKLLKQGFGVHTLNPVFWYGLNKMNLNIARINKARSDNELFAAKISQAVNLKNGSQDPVLDHQIEIYQDEIIKNVALIERIEKEYA